MFHTKGLLSDRLGFCMVFIIAPLQQQRKKTHLDYGLLFSLLLKICLMGATCKIYTVLLKEAHYLLPIQSLCWFVYGNNFGTVLTPWSWLSSWGSYAVSCSLPSVKIEQLYTAKIKFFGVTCVCIYVHR